MTTYVISIVCIITHRCMHFYQSNGSWVVLLIWKICISMHITIMDNILLFHRIVI